MPPVALKGGLLDVLVDAEIACLGLGDAIVAEDEPKEAR